MSRASAAVATRTRESAMGAGIGDNSAREPSGLEREPLEPPERAVHTVVAGLSSEFGEVAPPIGGCMGAIHRPVHGRRPDSPEETPPMRNLLNLTAAALTALLVQACGTSSTSNNNDAGATVQHVLLISVDGMHEQDMALCISNNTCPHIAALANTGVRFDTAFTPHMSDSFPGLAALITGGSPKSTGLFYDVSYDRNLYAPTDTTCSGGQGWNVVFDETTGLDGFDGGALVHLNGGGGFNPQAIPHEKDGGNCVPVYPHNYIRTNTIFEVVK